MIRFAPVVACVAFCAALPAALFAQTSPTLELGAPAPPLEIAEWVKGTSTTLEAGRGKQVYVVEFWATWCPPCRMSIPHLTEIQRKFADKGVTIIGITDEEPEKVKSFVAKQGDQMDYVVAVDKEGGTSKAYMKPFNVSGIPHAFVVDKEGRLAWHGHPMGNLEKTIEAVVAGTHDIEKTKRELAAEENASKYFQLAVKKDPRAKEVGESILRDAGENVELLNKMAWAILTAPQLKDNRDLDLAVRMAKAAVEGSEGKVAGILDTYARALYDTGKKQQAIEMQKKAISLAADEKERTGYEESLKKYEGKSEGE